MGGPVDGTADRLRGLGREMLDALFVMRDLRAEARSALRADDPRLPAGELAALWWHFLRGEWLPGRVDAVRHLIVGARPAGPFHWPDRESPGGPPRRAWPCAPSW